MKSTTPFTVWLREDNEAYRTAAPLELYDLRDDIAETNNFAASHPEVVAKLEAHLKTAREDSPDWPLFKQPASPALE